jgi:hypothetical protein
VSPDRTRIRSLHLFPEVPDDTRFAIGIALDVGIGAMMDNIAAGIAIGAVIGSAIGAAGGAGWSDD